MKLSSTEVKSFEIVRPICWIAANFQSFVLIWLKPPPIDDLKTELVAPVAAVKYGFVSFKILSKSLY